MASPQPSTTEEEIKPPSGLEHKPTAQSEDKMSESRGQSNGHNRTPEPSGNEHQTTNPETPGTPLVLAPFDWEDFEARFEQALKEAGEHEQQVLEEAEVLSKVNMICILQCF